MLEDGASGFIGSILLLQSETHVQGVDFREFVCAKTGETRATLRIDAILTIPFYCNKKSNWLLTNSSFSK